MNSIIPRTNEGRFHPGFIYSPETLFLSGQETHNKGKKFPGSGNKESFTKGHLPHNTLYDQAVTVRKNNSGNTYLFVRLAIGKWEFLQKANWIQEHGPIPAGKVLACINGDTLNADPSNWELITRGELAGRNRAIRKAKFKTCQVCGATFETVHNKQKYCSDECMKANSRKKYVAKQLIFSPISCIVCGTEFTPTHQHSRICSAGCRVKRQRIYNNSFHDKQPKKVPAERKAFVTSNEKICVICQASFLPKSNCQITCSENCAKTNNQLKKTECISKHKHEKHCARCGEYFTQSRRNLTICPTCKIRAPRLVKCLECGTEFTKSGKGAQLLCSLECKRDRRNKLQNIRPQILKTTKPRVLKEKVFKPKAIKFKAPVPERLILNKRNPKAEKLACLNMLELNRNAPVHDREALKAKNIESPDLATMEFKIYNKALRSITYFRTEEKYLNYLKNNK